MSVISKNTRFLVNAVLLSTAGYFRRQKWTHPVVAANTGIHAAITLTASPQTITTAITNPDFARTIRLKGSATADQAVVVTLNGTDIRGNALTEAVTMGGAFATPTDSTKAFKTLTSIVVPADAGGSTISVGPGAALGLDRIVLENSVVYSTVNAVADSALAVITPGAAIAQNVVKFTAALSNSNTFVVGYFANEVTTNSSTTA